MNKLFKISKWLHKYIGLFIVLYAIWMSVSGILLNHPNLIENYSVPKWLIPQRYTLEDNWNRKALKKAVYSQDNPKKVYISGSQGVWISEDRAKNFRKMVNGFPTDPYLGKTNDIILLGSKNQKLLAATDGGLFYCNVKDEEWSKIELDDESERVRKILIVKDELIVFTSSFVFKSELEAENFSFKKIQLQSAKSEERKFRLFSLIFHMHSGEIWGLPGRLVVDAIGLVLLFATLSGIYMWYMPWKKKKFGIRPTLEKRKIFAWLHKYHLKIGIISAVFVLFIGITGIFLLRPLSLTIIGKSVTSKYYPASLPENRFENMINNALYDEVEDRIIVQADRAFWSTSTDFSTPLKKIEMAMSAPDHGMSVFQPHGKDGFLMGSFGGIFNLHRDGSFTSLLPHKSGRTLITGYFKTPDGEEFVTALYKGLIPLKNSELNGRFVMPTEMVENFRWPLWSFLFSLHNGRIFSDLFGMWNTMIVFTFGVLFVIISIAGTYDWIYVKVIKPKLALKKKKKEQTSILVEDKEKV